MPSIDDIPDELLDAVFKNNYDDEGTLSSATLVCRRWRDPAQRALFRHLVFTAVEQVSRWLVSPARERFRFQSLQLEGRGDWAQPLEAFEGVTSLVLADRVDYDLLLLLSQSNLSRLEIAYPQYMHPLPSDPTPPFRLSHLHLHFYASVNTAFTEKLLLGSSTTLASLMLYSSGFIPSTVTAAVNLFSRMSFPLLRHLELVGHTPLFLNLLPHLSSLTTLTLTHILSPTLDTIFSAVARVAPPGLSVLSVALPISKPSTLLAAADLLRSLSSPGFTHLRELRLSRWLRDRNHDAATWAALAQECERRGLGLFVSEDFKFEGSFSFPILYGSRAP